MTLNISQPTSLAIPIDVTTPSGGGGVWITQMLVVLSASSAESQSKTKSLVCRTPHHNSVIFRLPNY